MTFRRPEMSKTPLRRAVSSSFLDHRGVFSDHTTNQSTTYPDDIYVNNEGARDSGWLAAESREGFTATAIAWRKCHVLGANSKSQSSRL